ncbi:MAG: FliI/YscN family ATPase [Pseudomonadota bacterium]
MDLSQLAAELSETPVRRRIGRILRAGHGALEIEGLAPVARLGDQVTVAARGAPDPVTGEIIALEGGLARAMTYGPAAGVGLGDSAELAPDPGPRPCLGWLGRVVDAFGRPLDGRPLPQGDPAPLQRPSPSPMARRRTGARLATGLSAFDALLPLVRGQRVGLFAGSGVGKSTLLAQLARGLEADHAVIALIGERGREAREFVEETLGPEGLARSIVVCATSDRSPLEKRRAAWTALAAAERLRADGAHVLLLVDSITRVAEAHREVALTAGEPPSLRAYPPSTSALLARLAERAGPGPEGEGDVTAVFSVLVAGSDMEEPIADMTRGLLDGHVVLTREIAERGRFPAVDLGRSVSRALPGCASDEERALIADARRAASLRERAEPMLQAGLWQAGADPASDRALRLHEGLEAFMAAPSTGPEDAYARLRALLEADAAPAGG